MWGKAVNALDSRQLDTIEERKTEGPGNRASCSGVPFQGGLLTKIEERRWIKKDNQRGENLYRLNHLAEAESGVRSFRGPFGGAENCTQGIFVGRGVHERRGEGDRLKKKGSHKKKKKAVG